MGIASLIADFLNKSGFAVFFAAEKLVWLPLPLVGALILWVAASKFKKSVAQNLLRFIGFAALAVGLFNIHPQLAMIGVGSLLIWLGIVKGFEPLLLLPIGFGAVLANLPNTNLLTEGEGLLYYIYSGGVKSGIFPPIIFMGIGAMTDFGPLLAQPYTFLLGAAAQLGIFATLIGAKVLGFTFAEASSIGIIGGADGPTSIYAATRMAPHLVGPIAVAAYSYMALVPVIQPPIIKLLTSKKERMIVMDTIKPVSKRVKILFPIITALVTCLLIPDAAPLLGMLMLGNLFKESGVVERLSDTAQNALINIVTIFLGIAVGSQMTAKSFFATLSDEALASMPAFFQLPIFQYPTINILILGLLAFSFGTAGGVLLGKLMCRLTGGKINPMIGAAGVSAVPMAARVVQKVGQQENPSNFLLMNAMGPNVAGVIGSAIAAGVLIYMNNA